MEQRLGESKGEGAEEPATPLRSWMHSISSNQQLVTDQQ